MVDPRRCSLPNRWQVISGATPGLPIHTAGHNLTDNSP